MLVRFDHLFDVIRYVANEHLISEVRDILPSNQAFLQEMREVLRLYAEFLQPFKKLSDNS